MKPTIRLRSLDRLINLGTYVLGNNATIDELLIAAGGPTTNADANAYLETTILIKGQSYYIAALYDESDICGDALLEKANINFGSKDELMVINGFGATIVTAIINYRNQNGSFTYLEELKKVSGIGNATFEKVKTISRLDETFQMFACRHFIYN